MTAIDHLFVFIIAVVHPVVAWYGYRRLIRRARAGEVVHRGRLYTMTILEEWALFAACLAIWAVAERPWDALGFSFSPDPQFLAGAGLTAVAVAFLWVQFRQVTQSSQADLDRFRRSLGTLELVVPRNGNELGRFYALSVTAGIVEETLWRGYLIWYLAHVMPLWAAAAVSSIGFGLAHSYQGPRNVPKIVVVGLVFAAVTLLTGSLWLAMVLHAVLDIVQGRMAFELVRRTDGGQDQPASVRH